MRSFQVVLFLCAMMLAGCSGGGTPLIPSQDVNPVKSVGSIDNLPIIGGMTYEDNSFHALGLMGSYELSIDPSSMTAELVSRRLPSLGQSWIVSGIGFFTIAPCSDCLEIGSIAVTLENYLQLTFKIRHPFEPGNTEYPPSAVNRLDLNIFDLALVVKPFDVSPENYPLTDTDAYVGMLVDNAGYTTELANVVGDNAALPYALVVDDNMGGSNTYNEFAMGDEKSFEVFFDLDMLTSFGFDMYLTMGYGASAQGKSQRLTPLYFNPEFNRKSAWKVVVTPPQGTDPPGVSNTWNNTDSATPFNVTVAVYDWQQGVTTIANPPVLPGDIAFASSVSRVTVEIPGMNTTLPESTTPMSGSGSPTDPLIYVIPVVNGQLLDAGEYIGLVKVHDERVPEATPTAIDFLIDAPDGVTLTNYAIPEFATYQTFIATVVVGCGPLTGSGQIIQPTCPAIRANGGSIIFQVGGYTSANANITYYADFDWDGLPANFTEDDSTTTGTFASHQFTIPGSTPVIYTVGFKAKDDCPDPDEEIFAATCEVTVNPGAAPVGNITLTLNRINGPTYGYQINPAQPWTLSWTAAAGAAEYAIYYDSDPTGAPAGYTDNLSLVGTTASTSYNVPTTHLPSNHYVVGNTYIVRSRSVLGDPLSENPTNSEPALIRANGWETLAAYVMLGIGNTGEGWLVASELAPTNYSRSWSTTSSTFAHGARGSYGWTPYYGNLSAGYSGRWITITKYAPMDVPGSTVRIVDVGATWRYGTAPPHTTGYCYGTTATQPTTPWITPSAIEWAYAGTGGSPAFEPYNTQYAYLATTFGGVDTTGNYCWQFDGSSTANYRRRIGGDVNNGGNSTHNYVALAIASETPNGNNPVHYEDDVAIIIY